MPSYSYLLKKAGKPAPTGLAPLPEKPRQVRGGSLTADAAKIDFMIELFNKVCASGYPPSPNFQASIVAALKELKRLKS